MSTKTTLLIDGDLFLFRASSAVEKPEKWDDENWVLTANERDAYDAFKHLLAAPIAAFDKPAVRVAFSSGNNFRKQLYPEYKSNRKGTRKPMCYGSVLEFIQRDYKTLSVPGLEADDIMGIWSTSGKVSDPVIVSDDKDMQGIPGKLWRNGELVEIDLATADHFWMLQTLTGDSTDGYSGLPGCGPQKALKALSGAKERTLEAMWPLVVAAYTKAGYSLDDALMFARLARILRAEDWNSETKEINLWHAAWTPSA